MVGDALLKRGSRVVAEVWSGEAWASGAGAGVSVRGLWSTAVVIPRLLLLLLLCWQGGAGVSLILLSRGGGVGSKGCWTLTLLLLLVLEKSPELSDVSGHAPMSPLAAVASFRDGRGISLMVDWRSPSLLSLVFGRAESELVDRVGRAWGYRAAEQHG